MTSTVWNSKQIASWIGSQLMHQPSMFERSEVCKFVRSLGRHPTLLKHSPGETEMPVTNYTSKSQDAPQHFALPTGWSLHATHEKVKLIGPNQEYNFSVNDETDLIGLLSKLAVNAEEPIQPKEKPDYSVFTKNSRIFFSIGSQSFLIDHLTADDNKRAWYSNLLENALTRLAHQEVTPVEEQGMFEAWCPYKGTPDPRTVWAAATAAINQKFKGE